MIGAIVRLSRPFTLLAPALGMIAAALAALGWSGSELTGWSVRKIAIGALGALLLNVASNAVNQIYDIEVDRINKPARPLPAGDLSIRAAWVVCIATYAGAAFAAWCVNDLLLVIVLFTVLLTYAYSGPPFRTKRHWALSNLTIAIPRGFLLPLAGWAVIAGSPEAGLTGDALPTDVWAFAAASGLFVLGAASTKDFADLEGDEAGGCITLPLRFGIKRSVQVIAPSLVLPWVLLIGASLAGWMSGGNGSVVICGGALLVALGARAGYLLIRDPDALTDQSTHPAWVLMYLMMLVSQAVFALAYLFGPGGAPA